MSNYQQCAIINEKTNTTVVRLIAIQVVVISVLFLVTKNPIFIWLLLADFFIRGVLRKSNGLFFIIANLIEKKILQSGKPIDKAPKLFAAFIGFVFSLVIVITYLLEWYALSFSLAAVLILFALLEGVFEYCVACQFYSIYQCFKK